MSDKKFIARFIRQYPLMITGNIILGFSGALFNGVNTALIVPVVLQITGQEIDVDNAPQIIRVLLSPFDGIPEQYRLSVMLFAIIFTIILKNLTLYCRSLLSVAFIKSLTNTIKSEMLQTLLDTDLDFYSKTKIGDLIKRLGSDTAQTTQTINSYIDLVSQVITIFLFLWILLSLSWQLTIVSSILAGGIVLINQLIIRRSKYLGNILNQQQKNYSVKVIETLNGIRLIKSVGTETREYKTIRKIMLEIENLALKTQMNSALIQPLNEVTSILTVIFILILGRYLFADQLENLSAILLTYLLVLFRLLPVISNLSNIRNQIARGAASFETAYDLWRRDNKPIMSSGKLQFIGFEDKIHFRNISFAYPGQSQMVIKDVDLSLYKGTTLALVGGSGAGKSTFADLLPRFYDPTSGGIEIDGVDIREYDIRSLRQEMGIVSQTTFLFNDTVKNNIMYARPDATDEEIRDAAKQANAYDFIMALPRQWETEIGDRGVMLSGGQRQRLAIARALLQKPKILILDEATSALDTVSERLVQEAIDRLSRDRTVLVIAHRLSTVQKADQIAVLERGELMEVGTHHELLQKEDGYYRRLHDIQFSDQDQSQSTIDEQVLAKSSYEARGFLNSIIGSLRLLADGIIDTPEEQEELTEEAYQSAISLLRTLEVFENKLRS
ncbi:MAG: ABC transporter ATP-binding protein [Limnospira sp. PMC 894.15]|uniref:ABC transporter ATP-binding protein n=1 Tax=Limnospira fusiformis PMC 851.14 TaxID=2219512 RepID=A0ABU9EQQ2_LIMFS|nr:ABC transporter ATP-binding protein [Limnospira sp. PMC 894.15]MDT9187506.1 ABC transporter ATP-binding protein [Limnospira sp. PMC 894.15]